MMSLIQQGAFNLKNCLMRPIAQKLYRSVKKEALLSDEERQALAFERARTLVKTAFDNCDFYREKYRQAGLDDGMIQSMSDFSRLPPLEKQDIRNYRQEMCNRTVRKKYFKATTTGGSTGEPVTVYHDGRVPVDAIGWFAVKNFGGDISDNAAFCLRHNPHQAHPFFNRLLWFPTERCFMDITLITEEKWWYFYRQCQKKSVRYLQGYVGAIHEFACFLQKNGLVLPSLRFVWTTSAPLSDSSRFFMEQVFGVPVYDQYGCCEIFWLAYECKLQSGLHYCDTLRYFEVCDANNNLLSDGNEGELLITDLLNHAFPLIRYRNGDRVQKLSGTCDCGCRFPRIASVKGRITDVIRLPNGNCIPGDFLTTIFDDYPDAVNGFQVLQRKDFSLVVRYVPAGTHSSAIVASVCKKLAARLVGSPIEIFSEVVSEIPHDRGKTRFIVSELADANKVYNFENTSENI